jgi:hypothetical protein
MRRLSQVAEELGHWGNFESGVVAKCERSPNRCPTEVGRSWHVLDVS